jgi:hypothetical protein
MGEKSTRTSVACNARATYASAMQHLFSMFPGRSAGIALLVLRVSLMLAIFLAATPIIALHPWMRYVAIVIAFLICIGFATPICAALCFVFAVYLMVVVHDISVTCSGFTAGVAMAVALLGPGAFSADAVLFGRRRMVFDKDKQS